MQVGEGQYTLGGRDQNLQKYYKYISLNFLNEFTIVWHFCVLLIHLNTRENGRTTGG